MGRHKINKKKTKKSFTQVMEEYYKRLNEKLMIDFILGK